MARHGARMRTHEKMCAALVFALATTLCGAASPLDNNPAPIGSEGDPLRAYYGNTYTCYWPGLWECHHWWNADGTEDFFVGQWMPEGLMMLSTVEAPHFSWVGNGQWCSHNARTAVGEANNAREAEKNPN